MYGNRNEFHYIGMSDLITVESGLPCEVDFQQKLGVHGKISFQSNTKFSVSLAADGIPKDSQDAFVKFQKNGDIFAISGSIVETVRSEFSLSWPADLFRWQRRQDFRVKVPPGETLEIELKSFCGQRVRETELVVLDISASGAKVLWPRKIEKPKIGDDLRGELIIKGREQVTVLMRVENIYMQNGRTHSVGCSMKVEPSDDLGRILFYCVHTAKKIDKADD